MHSVGGLIGTIFTQEEVLRLVMGRPTLPDDTLVEIFKNLRPDDIQKVRLTAKSFRKILDNRPEIMATVAIALHLPVKNVNDATELRKLLNFYQCTRPEVEFETRFFSISDAHHPVITLRNRAYSSMRWNIAKKVETLTKLAEEQKQKDPLPPFRSSQWPLHDKHFFATIDLIRRALQSPSIPPNSYVVLSDVKENFTCFLLKNAQNQIGQEQTKPHPTEEEQLKAKLNRDGMTQLVMHKER